MSQKPIYSKYDSIESLANLVESEVKKTNIPKYDIYLLDERVNGIYFRKTDVEEQTNYHNLTYLIRIFNEKSTKNMGIGFVQLNSTNSKHIQAAIQKAIKIAMIISKIADVPKYDLVSPGMKYSSPKTYEKNIWNNPHEFLDEKTQELRNALKEINHAKSTFGNIQLYRKQKMLLNSNGFSKLKKSTDFSFEFSFIAKNNLNRSEYWPRGFIKSSNDLNFNEWIPEWATRAKDSLNAKYPSNDSNIDVMFAPNLVRKAILSSISYSISGQALYEKYSKFQIDSNVADEKFTLIDDGLFEGGLGTSSWDSEGFPKQRTPVIENGIMKNFLFDQKFATLLNTKSTGNAQRKSKNSGNMSIEFNNLIILSGDQSLKEIVSNSKKAILVLNIPWLFPNIITGNFGASIENAYMIENGKITVPIKGGSISGNIFNMLKNIEAISKETRIIKNANIPYIKFKNLKLFSM